MTPAAAPRPGTASKWNALRPIAWGVAAAAGVGVVGAMMLWLAGAFHPKAPTTTPAAAATPLDSRQFVEVRRIRRPRFETASGTVKPVHEVALAAKLLAKVLEIRVKAGQAVREGELLVKLDDEALVARVKQAEAAAQAAAASRERTTADRARAAKLVKTSVVTQAEYDAAVAADKLAAAEVERRQREIEEAGVLLSYAQIKSPITGTVIDKKIEAGDTVAPGQVLLALYDPKQMQMVATVRESLALRLKVGQKVPARLDSLGFDCQALISEIVPEAQAASRSFQVKVTGPCPPGVYSGMFGRLHIPLDDEDVLVIPAAAVKHVGQLTLVEVAQEGRAVRRSVQLGRTLGEDVEVLAGLRAGERVRQTEPPSPGSSP